MSVHPLVIANPLAIDSVNRALSADRHVALIFQDGENDAAPDEELARIGTAGIIRQMARGQGSLQVLVEGVTRIGSRRSRARRQFTGAHHALSRSRRADARSRRLRAPPARDGRPRLRARHRPAAGAARDPRQIDDPLRLCYLLASLIDMKPKRQAAAARAGRPVGQARAPSPPRSAARSSCSRSRGRSSRRRSRR